MFDVERVLSAKSRWNCYALLQGKVKGKVAEEEQKN